MASRRIMIWNELECKMFSIPSSYKELNENIEKEWPGKKGQLIFQEVGKDLGFISNEVSFKRALSIMDKESRNLEMYFCEKPQKINSKLIMLDEQPIVQNNEPLKLNREESKAKSILEKQAQRSELKEKIRELIEAKTRDLTKSYATESIDNKIKSEVYKKSIYNINKCYLCQKSLDKKTYFYCLLGCPYLICVDCEKEWKHEHPIRKIQCEVEEPVEDLLKLDRGESIRDLKFQVRKTPSSENIQYLEPGAIFRFEWILMNVSNMNISDKIQTTFQVKESFLSRISQLKEIKKHSSAPFWIEVIAPKKPGRYDQILDIKYDGENMTTLFFNFIVRKPQQIKKEVKKKAQIKRKGAKEALKKFSKFLSSEKKAWFKEKIDFFQGAPEDMLSILSQYSLLEAEAKCFPNLKQKQLHSSLKKLTV